MADSTYTARQVAQLLSAKLGEPVTETSVYLALRRRSARPNARMSATHALPDPAGAPGDGPLRFDRGQIDRWLERHPRLERAQLLSGLREEIAASQQRRADAIRRGRAAGISWGQLAEIIAAVDGVPISRQAVAARYGRAES